MHIAQQEKAKNKIILKINLNEHYTIRAGWFTVDTFGLTLDQLRNFINIK